MPASKQRVGCAFEDMIQIQVTGKHLSVGDALKEHVETRLGRDVARYFANGVRAHVTFEKQRSQFQSGCTLHLATGMVLQAQGESADARSAFDTAADHLEKRLKRYKQRLRDHHAHRRQPVSARDVASFVIRSAQEEDGEEPTELNPVIIAEEKETLQELTVGEAAMQLDISSVPFVLFANSKDGQVNLVYRRDDGNIGWIDTGTPRASAKG
jgi:ribosomal subunit interface protein